MYTALRASWLNIWPNPARHDLNWSLILLAWPSRPARNGPTWADRPHYLCRPLLQRYHHGYEDQFLAMWDCIKFQMIYIDSILLSFQFSHLVYCSQAFLHIWPMAINGQTSMCLGGYLSVSKYELYNATVLEESGCRRRYNLGKLGSWKAGSWLKIKCL